MKHYCVCGQNDNKVVLGKCCHAHDHDEPRAAFACQPMEVERIGVPQFTHGTAGLPHKHLPNVDILKCKQCGRCVILEG